MSKIYEVFDKFFDADLFDDCLADCDMYDVHTYVCIRTRKFHVTNVELPADEFILIR